MKVVPDTATKIKVKGDNSGIETEGVEYIIDPYCEFAIEQGLLLKEKFSGSHVTAVYAGPDRGRDPFTRAYAMGVDEVVHINEAALENADGLCVAKTLAAVIKERECDLVLCGKQAVDDGAYQIGACLSGLLSVPIVSAITKLDIEAETGPVVVEREMEGAKEIYEVQLPAVLTCEKGLCEPRYPSLPGIMKGKKKPVDTKDFAALGIDPASAGDAALVAVAAYSLPSEKQAGQTLEGDPKDVAEKLVKLLQDEAKVI